jgi:hypothetical protein
MNTIHHNSYIINQLEQGMTDRRKTHEQQLMAARQHIKDQRRLQLITTAALLLCLVMRPLSTSCMFNFFISHHDITSMETAYQDATVGSTPVIDTLLAVHMDDPPHPDLFSKNDSKHAMDVGSGSVENMAMIQTVTPVYNATSDEYCDRTEAELVEARTKCAGKTTEVSRFCPSRCAGAEGQYKAFHVKHTAWCARLCDLSCVITFCPKYYVPPRKPMPLGTEVHVYRPQQANVNRLIPRIVHQTWREPISKENYPNWIEFQASFQQEGYEYRFYTDDEARSILEAHFPVEIVLAYDDLLPGAFKADLFRYCILLLYGGIYADIDITMTRKLDDVIDHDTGFLIPLDKQPFSNENKTLCLWNGFMAVSPGHPFMAKVVENVVNAVRNRYTYVDYAKMVSCPFQSSESEMKQWVFLFATGPCMLGLTVNQVLGRHEQTTFLLGELQGNTDVPGKSVFMETLRNKVCHNVVNRARKVVARMS